MRTSGYAHQASYRCALRSCHDRDGISESFVQYEWGAAR